MGKIALQLLRLLGVEILQHGNLFPACPHGLFATCDRSLQGRHLGRQFFDGFDRDGCVGQLEIVGSFRTLVENDETHILFAPVDFGECILFCPGRIEFLDGNCIKMELAARFAQGIHFGGIEVSPVQFLCMGLFGS